ncbi:ribonuclease HII [Virgibacillus ainsalahensis]
MNKVKNSIAELKELLENDHADDELISRLQMDERKGVHQLIKTYEKKKIKKEALEKKYLEMCRYEKRSIANGCEFIVGVDEAGRGPLAGPVVAAAVILPHEFKLIGLNDSKQLNEATRNEFYTIIKEQAISYGISVISNHIIDEINIYEATKQAMREAINQLNPEPDHVLIDAVELNGLPYSTEAIIKGDSKSVSIAAASVLAKVTRDNMMKEIHKKYPAYDFSSNMGYGTKHHMKSLVEHGTTPYHRKSFAPVRNVAHQ